MTSKEIGDLMSMTLVEHGKELSSEMFPGVDYDDLPARTLTDLGKQALSDSND